MTDEKLPLIKKLFNDNIENFLEISHFSIILITEDRKGYITSASRNFSDQYSKNGFQLKKHTRIVFLISYFDNLITCEHHNLEIIKNLPSFSFLKIIAKTGSHLKKTTDMFSMPGLLILSHESADQVENDYKMIRSLEKEGLFQLEVKE